MRRRLPIGIQTFGELREEHCYYVDKTAYVKRLLDEGKHAGSGLFVDLRVHGGRPGHGVRAGAGRPEPGADPRVVQRL